MMNTIAGGGTYHTPRFCYGVTDADGTLTDPFQLPAPRIVCDAATAKTLRSMLQSVVEDGIGHARQTRRRHRRRPRPAPPDRPV